MSPWNLTSMLGSASNMLIEKNRECGCGVSVPVPIVSHWPSDS